MEVKERETAAVGSIPPPAGSDAEDSPRANSSRLVQEEKKIIRSAGHAQPYGTTSSSMREWNIDLPEKR